MSLSRKRRAAPRFLAPYGGRAGRSLALGALSGRLCLSSRRNRTRSGARRAGRSSRQRSCHIALFSAASLAMFGAGRNGEKLGGAPRNRRGGPRNHRVAQNNQRGSHPEKGIAAHAAQPGAATRPRVRGAPRGLAASVNERTRNADAVPGSSGAESCRVTPCGLALRLRLPALMKRGLMRDLKPLRQRGQPLVQRPEDRAGRDQG